MSRSKSIAYRGNFHVYILIVDYQGYDMFTPTMYNVWNDFALSMKFQFHCFNAMEVHRGKFGPFAILIQAEGEIQSPLL